jgi:tetratricopeptide (TPR) repeat protein
MNYKLENSDADTIIFRLDKKITFNEILKVFFNKTAINEFHKMLGNAETKSGISNPKFGKTEKKQIEYVPEKQSDVLNKIDLLITFGFERLSRNKYLLFILNLGSYCITIGELSTAIVLFDRIIKEVKKENKFFIIKADALLKLSEAYRRKAEWQNSFAYAKKALHLYSKNNDLHGLANSFNILGTIYGEQGDFKSALRYFEKCLDKVAKSKNSEFKGKVEINLGIIYTILGNYDAALSYFNRALITYNKSGNIRRIAEIRHNIGFLYLRNQKTTSALKEFDRSIATSIKIGYLTALGNSYLGKSFTFAIQKDYNLADAFADKAMQICSRTNDKLSVADVYKIKGVIQRERNNFAEAENFLKTSLRINKEYGNKFNEAETYLELASLYKKIGNPGKSNLMFTEALKYFRSLKAEVKVKAIKEQISTLSAA